MKVMQKKPKTLRKQLGICFSTGWKIKEGYITESKKIPLAFGILEPSKRTKSCASLFKNDNILYTKG